jgi:hypothetical protein
VMGVYLQLLAKWVFIPSKLRRQQWESDSQAKVTSIEVTSHYLFPILLVTSILKDKYLYKDANINKRKSGGHLKSAYHSHFFS